MKKNLSGILFARVFLLISISLPYLSNAQNKADGNYPIEPVSFTSVTLNDHFWKPKIKINHDVTIPIAIEQSEISGRIKNFEIAGGQATGDFCSQYPFDDSDIYKIIEAASYSLQTNPDKNLDHKLDSLIAKIAIAQEKDGYICTNLTIAQKNHTEAHPWIGSERWEHVNELSHELYNLGHMFEAAAAHYEATGKRNFLDIAIKAADMLDATFGWGKLENYPGHQVVEMGLVQLYRVTGEKRYLNLAKFFLDVRGPGGEEYCQAHKKVINQTEAVGHAVRATYMYAAMADIAALYNDDSYLKASHAIWEDMVHKKTYVTGGIGASGGNEGFANPYELPNMAAYCETCASIGEVFWNYRMFLFDGNSKYYDVLERTLYNALISGVNLEGNRFFYPNPLESIGQHSRSKWFGCACCPPNIARLLPSLPGYIYAKTDKSLFVNLFMENTAQLEVNNTNVTISQHTEYPWNGKITIDVSPEKVKAFDLKIRIPGWSQNEAIPGDLYTFDTKTNNKIDIILNGKPYAYKMDKGYAVISKKWKKGDVISFDLTMTPKTVLANEKVKDDRNKMAVQYGPMMYIAEWPDMDGGKVLNLIVNKDQKFEVKKEAKLLGGVNTINGSTRIVKATTDGGFSYSKELPLKLIPYYSWNNRGAGEMTVWMPYNENSIRPLPAPSIASNSKVSASTSSKSLIAINDQLLPKDAIDHTWPYYHWWPKNDCWEWIQYDFEKEETVSSSKVYWYDDSPFGGCRVPTQWEILYKDGENWIPVKAKGEYKVTKDQWDTIEFEPVKTTALKLRIKLPKEFSTGIHEWIVE
ncbi:glycoside hydrolase family 127 protein [Plebeiibacterium sediminum]|uniref:Glycoside hydrolase family 127 protein n=1 Tax=Plebeiibacterium sediminum TaxID=2992112 RepID=A0AAE3M3G6_9BACT|nr:beta-L-arabinofuranosidase domain-containing protein [Plebeiobacterium sediminum]MCW3786306.1 glycoside hydrolase family 127 protein [Plebeiobacterium sediminum]